MPKNRVETTASKVEKQTRSEQKDKFNRRARSKADEGKTLAALNEVKRADIDGQVMAISSVLSAGGNLPNLPEQASREIAKNLSKGDIKLTAADSSPLDKLVRNAGKKYQANMAQEKLQTFKKPDPSPRNRSTSNGIQM